MIECKGKHTGKISFENGEAEAFMLNLTPDDTEKYLQLISDKLVGSASQLADKLLSSMNLLPIVETHAAIEEAIPAT